MDLIERDTTMRVNAVFSLYPKGALATGMNARELFIINENRDFPVT